jgi:hypothetical protein
MVIDIQTGTLLTLAEALFICPCDLRARRFSGMTTWC